MFSGWKICKLCLVYSAESSALLHHTIYYCTLPLQQVTPVHCANPLLQLTEAYHSNTLQSNNRLYRYTIKPYEIMQSYCNIRHCRSIPRLCFTRHHFAIAPQNWTKSCSTTTGYHGSAPCHHIIMRYITTANFADANPNASEPDHTLPVHGLAVSQSTKP